MTQTASDNTLLLEIIAKDHYFDPRKLGVKLSSYTENLGMLIQGLMVCVIKKWFEILNMEESTKNWILNESKVFEILDVIVEEPSIPGYLVEVANLNSYFKWRISRNGDKSVHKWNLYKRFYIETLLICIEMAN